MSNLALERFRLEFRYWVTSHNKTHNFRTEPEELLKKIEAQIPTETLSQIGSAYINGWLMNETEPNRSYFVRETDRAGSRGGQFTLIHRGYGTVEPCWELYIQLADYAWLRTVAERYGLHVRLEDGLMDLTVRTSDSLVLYVEHKLTKEKAEELLFKMSEYGRRGFDLADKDRGNDPLRKAKYLVRDGARPLYFGLSAIGYKQLFRVEYFEVNRFELHADDSAFASVLTLHRSAGTTQIPPWSGVDALAIEVQRLCPSCWVSVGSGQTAYNFYAPGAVDAIVVGVTNDGLLWTDLERLGQDRAARLIAALAALDIEVSGDKMWSRWKRDGKALHIGDADPLAVANAIRIALESENV